MKRKTTLLASILVMTLGYDAVVRADREEDQRSHEQVAVAPAAPAQLEGPGNAPGVPATAESPAAVWTRGRFTSVQANVSLSGGNIIGDAANEPSLAIDPTNPDIIVIGWRQFDTISSNFREAGKAYSHDRGATWTNTGVLQNNVFRSDPVLDADSNGTIFYYSLSTLSSCETFRSATGGVSWLAPVPAFGGDKAWMVVDRTGGIGDGNIYAKWQTFFGCCGSRTFTRSTDGGLSFEFPLTVPLGPSFGTLAVGPDGAVYAAGIEMVNFQNFSSIVIARSSNAQDAGAVPTFEFSRQVDMGGSLGLGGGPNPAGLLGQVWVAVDHSGGPTHGNVYMLSSVNPPGADPLDVMFSRSTDRGETWTPPVRINDDAFGNGAWQWFGTMSVAPNGRIDVIWNDTRSELPNSSFSELYYAYSEDAGDTWSVNEPVSPQFYSLFGWPQQNKLGDYYHMISDNDGASVAYAATFTGGQDVYFLRIGVDCNGNDIADEDEVADGLATDCNDNGVPDECDIAGGSSTDCDADVVPDECGGDTDGDGHIDNCDNCPFVANENQADVDLDGVGDVCDPCPVDALDDRDGDGVCDSDDPCFQDPLKIDPGQCGCGVEDVDEDGDGVAECVDLCPGVDDRVFGPECAGQIPAVSTWGLVVFTLVLLTGGKIFFRRRLLRAS